jgi:hypothetical protein
MKTLRSLAIGFAALLVALLATPARAQTPGPVDGLWKSTNTPDTASIQKGAVAFEENVLIENSQATREVFSQYGFTPVPSQILSLTPLVTYKTVYTDTKFGTLTVNGTVQASLTTITGTMSWARADGSTWNYTFTMTKIGSGPTP